ncbi:hypothetical protein TNCV_3458511 [Trichonephila clavipes]|nr:hypothetical protein TNCV_3458511 [Trichonephila clavipes]
MGYRKVQYSSGKVQKNSCPKICHGWISTSECGTFGNRRIDVRKVEIHIILKKDVKYGFMSFGVSVEDFERKAYFHTKDGSVFEAKNEQQIWRFLLAVEKNKFIVYRHTYFYPMMCYR